MREVVSVGAGPVDGLDRAGYRVTTLELDEVPPLDVRVSPGNLETSYRLYRFLEGRRCEAVVFGDIGANGYCSARAKQLGLAFPDTRIVVRWQSPLQWRAERSFRASLSKDEVRQIVCERLAFELADTVIVNRAELDWIKRQAWELEGGVFPDDPDGWRKALESPLVRGRQTDERPPVTVVVPHYDRAELLPRCLEGLAAQTYPALEVIVVDDGSPSAEARAALAAVEQRSWPWPLRVLRRDNAGADAARNTGWRAAAHDLVVFIDDDDVPFDNLVESLVETRAYAGADVVAAGIRTFPPTGRPEPRPGDVVGIFLARPYEFGLIANQYGGPVCLWPKQLLQRVDGFRHAERLQEDGEILVRATLAGAKIVAVPRPLYWNRLTPDGRYGASRSALREGWPAVVGRLYAEQLPGNLRLAPLLVGGAFAELEQERSAPPAWAARVILRTRGVLGRLRRAAAALLTS
ncbi:MAG: hypothetical protein QOD85_2586 [Gaiellaceae bacterium]|nr:hypothetical protein [Gaiellaceae bacterium]